VIKLQERY
jgi:hypothetical protein